MITEPDVSLTDYGLAVECSLFTSLLARAHDGSARLRWWFVFFFAVTGVAALAGGTVHGFFLDERSLGARVLWPLTLLAIGLAALAAWQIGARLHFSSSVVHWISILAAGQFLGYAAVVLLVSQAFVVAILDYLPAVVFLTAVFALGYRRTREPAQFSGLAGLVLTFVASAIQWGGVGLHPVYFTHNALQHVVQGAALFLLFRAARSLARGAGG